MSFDWTENENGNFVKVEWNTLTTVFERDGLWLGVKEEAFTDEYESAEAAMTAIDEEQATFTRPRHLARDWKKTKVGGYYRDIGGTRQSVKLAKSNKWFVVHAGMLVEDEWFDEAHEAKAYADMLAFLP